VAESTVKQIRASLAASHEEGERILARTAAEVRAIDAEAQRTVRGLAEQRLRQIDELRAALLQHSREVELAYARMIEALAATSMRLVEITREADFGPPAWSGGLPRTVELKLRETREVTMRFSEGGEPGGGHDWRAT
jgi:hypothetical protein